MQATFPKSAGTIEYKYVIVDSAGKVACKEKDARKANVAGSDYVVRDEVLAPCQFHGLFQSPGSFMQAVAHSEFCLVLFGVRAILVALFCCDL